MTVKRIAVLTSGGDAPGMNAAIRSVVRTASAAGVETVGVKWGFRGLMEGEFTPLDNRSVGGIMVRGGTMLGSARAPEFRTEAGRDRGLQNLREAGIGGLVVIGGNGSQTGGLSLHRAGFPTVGIASTIDNDLTGFDTSIGVDTALNTGLELIDRLRDTATSHHRAFVVEVMGRNSGYLAEMVGIASGAELILVPEDPQSLDDVCAAVRKEREKGKAHVLVVVAEGNPIHSAEITERMQAQGDFETRMTILGHVQRGGRPLAFDRLLASRSAFRAVQALVQEGESGKVAGLAEGKISLVPTETAIQPGSKLTPELLHLGETLSR